VLRNSPLVVGPLREIAHVSFGIEGVTRGWESPKRLASFEGLIFIHEAWNGNPALAGPTLLVNFKAAAIRVTLSAWYT
jgi:hypothetical protein